MSKELFTDDEVRRLVLALGKGQEQFTDDDMHAVIVWANETRLMTAMLTMVLSGEVVLRVRDDGEVVFQHINGKEWPDMIT